MKKIWFKTTYLKAAPASVDRPLGIIRGVKVCSAGEAKGHGVHLDSEFIETVVAQGKGLKKGLKARFGHPSMCKESLGTFIGRFTNFSQGITRRADGTQAECCFADLQLSETAKKAPGGDLYEYVQDMAENEADVFGTSIVFARGETYRRDAAGKKVYRRNQDGSINDAYDDAPQIDYAACKSLVACDCVDNPAANDGLLSAPGESVAAEISAFFDANPQVFQLLEDTPEIMEAIGQYGSKIDEFVERYRAYRERSADLHHPLTPTHKESVMPKVLSTTHALGEDQELPETIVEPGQKTKQPAEVAASTQTQPVDVGAAVEKALAAERLRTAAIDELGAKFGFTVDVAKFKADGGTVEQFRAHILNKSPDDWSASLAIKNPAQQNSEQEQEEFADGASAVDAIKARRQERFGSK